jgi:hypothetical protein
MEHSGEVNIETPYTMNLLKYKKESEINLDENNQ